MGFGSLTFGQEAATGDVGFSCLVSVSCEVPPGKPQPQPLDGTAAFTHRFSGSHYSRHPDHPMARVQVKKTQEGPTLSWGFLRRMGRRRTDSSPRRPEESLICEVSGGRLGTKHRLPRDPVPPAPRGTGRRQGWLVKRTHPVIRPASLHASTHPATSSSPPHNITSPVPQSPIHTPS